MSLTVEPHPFVNLGWRWWLCRRCYLPRSLHPTNLEHEARPLGDMSRNPTPQSGRDA